MFGNGYKNPYHMVLQDRQKSLSNIVITGERPNSLLSTEFQSNEEQRNDTG